MFNKIKGIKNTVKNAANALTDKDFIKYVKQDCTFPTMVAANVIGVVGGIAAGAMYANDLMDKKDFATCMFGEGLIVSGDAMYLYGMRKVYNNQAEWDKNCESMARAMNRIRYGYDYYTDVVNTKNTVE